MAGSSLLLLQCVLVTVHKWRIRCEKYRGRALSSAWLKKSFNIKQKLVTIFSANFVSPFYILAPFSTYFVSISIPTNNQQMPTLSPLSTYLLHFLLCLHFYFYKQPAEANFGSRSIWTCNNKERKAAFCQNRWKIRLEQKVGLFCRGCVGAVSDKSWRKIGLSWRKKERKTQVARQSKMSQRLLGQETLTGLAGKRFCEFVLFSGFCVFF